jgi:predicted HD phosphohydrolase
LLCQVLLHLSAHQRTHDESEHRYLELVAVVCKRLDELRVGPVDPRVHDVDGYWQTEPTMNEALSVSCPKPPSKEAANKLEHDQQFAKCKMNMCFKPLLIRASANVVVVLPD